MKNKLLGSISFVFIMLLTLSACSMFTSSLGKDFARDKAEVFKNASASDLATAATDPQSVDPDTANAIMEALGDKKDELLDLPIEQKEAVLDFALGATIPISTVTEALKDIDLDNFENMSDDDISALLDTVFDSVNEFDTTAINALLTDPDTLKKADPSTLAEATVAIIAQVAKDIGIEKIMGDATAIPPIDPPSVDFEKDTPADIVAELLGAQTPDQSDEDFAQAQEDLTAAVMVIQLLLNGTANIGGETVTRDPAEITDIKILGVISLEDILGGLGNTPTASTN